MIDGKRVLAIVPARAGSQGLPGKNVRPLAGKPMVAWTLEAGLASTHIDRLVVSTDDPAVAAVARDRGVEVLDRPPELATATASVMDAIAHVLRVVGGVWDYVILLQPTSPLRMAADIDGALRLCHDRDAPAVIGVSPMPKPPGFYGRIDADGRFHKAPPSDEEAVIINGAVYIGRPERLAQDGSFQTPKTLTFSIPPERGWDVDTLLDFLIADTLAPHIVAGADLGGVRR